MKEGALYELPGGWVWTNLEESFDIVLGQSPPSSSYNLNGSGLPFYQGKSEFSNVYPTPKKWCTAPKKISEKGDVLISVRAPVGPTNICSEKSCIGRGLAAIRPLGGIETFFTLYMMRAFENIIAGKGTGTTFSAITGDKLKKFEVPLPPLPEQRAIVSKIEQLFSDLDNGIENFKKAQEQLKIYRQAVTEAELARAEGRDYEPADVLLARILKERREKWNGKGKYKEPAAPDTSGLPEVTSGTLSWFVTSGSRDWRKYYSSSGALFIRTQDINKNKLSLDNVAFVALPEKAEGKRSLVQKNDILIIITGANVGKVALVDTKISEAYVSQSVALMKLVMPDIARYLHFAMIADGFGKTELDKMVYGMGRPVLSLENVRDIILPLSPLAEQRRIVTELERRLSFCDKMEATIAESLKKAEALRQSILKKAFEGKLLNEKELEEARNTPDWEPAEKLLERIKAQKNN